MRKKANPGNNKQASVSRWNAIFTVGTVGLLLWLPLIGLVLGQKSRISAMEQRSLAKSPSLGGDWREWTSLPKQTEDWFDDYLGFRDTLIRNHARLMVGLFAKSPSEKLILGKQGWLFYGDHQAVAHYRGLAPLSQAELIRWQRVLEQRRNALAERGIAYLLVLVPDKHQAYAEYMPENLPRLSDVHPLGQLARHMEEHSEVEVLDLREHLSAAKSQQRIYQRTDSHWNDEGAYAAYVAILERLAKITPELSEHQPIAIRRNQHRERGMGLAGLVGLGAEFPEEVIEVAPASPRARIARNHRARYNQRVRTGRPLAHGVEGSSYPRAVMFRDSFGNALIPFLSEHFQRILYVWNRDVDISVVEVEKPDVVIQQVVGRFLTRRPKGLEEAKTIKVPGVSRP